MKRAYTPRTPCRQKIATGQTESLQVFCRLRPKTASTESSCVKILSNSTVQLTLPESSVNFRANACREYQYSFKRVFAEGSKQKEIFDEVALPLVFQLIKGRNGLLFTYGVTGSGKTYTMTGSKQNAGIMPRCLDVLFNSINDYQARKYVFKPDRMNGFEVQTEEDAKHEREESLKNAAGKFGRLKKKESYEDLTSSRSKEELKIEIEEDNAYAVFITYVEIYNNNAYDLLENTSNDICAKSQRKIIREDAAQNMYIHGVTEVEVKSAEEAFEVFYRGQNRKKIAHTVLNNESSRSHSIFTIRLVQAPLDPNGETVLQDKKLICVSQLSLVDLAGSERTNRTRNQGQRLREAGNINNSLMTLRSCLEILRENQLNGGNKMIPYRDSRLTHMFKNFFEGEGNIRMIICVNPRIDDYDENIQVMKFAEFSQEILVKPTPLKTDVCVGLTPGRRKANQAYKKALQILEEVKENRPNPYIPNDAEIIYNFQPFPSFDNIDPLDEEFNKKLILFLEERLKRKDFLRSDLMSRVDKFRAGLIQSEENYLKFKMENDAANACLESKDTKIKVLEDRLVSLDSFSSTLKRKCEEYADEIKRLKKDSEMKDNIICQYGIEKDKDKQKTRKMAAKTEKLAQERKNSLKEKQDIQMRLKDRENRLRRVRKVLESNEESARKTKIPRIHPGGYGSDTESSSVSSTHDAFPVQETPKMTQRLRPRTVNTIAVSNPRYGNRQCNIHDQWLEHRAAVLAPLNTIMQPVLKKRKSVTKVTKQKDVTTTSKYCLMTQNHDETGVLETQLYKGDVVPTAGGGAQVIFNDVETLKQLSPTSPVISPRKQLLDELNTSIASKNIVRFV